MRIDLGSRRFLIIYVIFLEAVLMIGCGGGSGEGNSTPPASNPKPAITSLSPSSATAGSAAQTLTINGTDFMSISTVTYNGAAHTSTFVSSTQLAIQLTASDQATAGTYPVVVTNPTPGGGASNTVNFSVNKPSQPVISSVTPIYAGNHQTITILGSGFGATPPQTTSLGDGSVDTVACNVSTPSLVIDDSGTGNHAWGAGRQTCSNSDAIGLYLISWSDSQIVLGGFGSALGTTSGSPYEISPGDPLSVDVTGPNGTGDAVYQTTVAAGASLTVNITDLPSGVPAKVTVTEPSGSTVLLAGSETISGSAGSYTVSAAPVAVGSTSYYATTATQSTSIAQDQSSTLTVDYYQAVPNTTKVLDQAGSDSLVVSSDDSTLTMSSSSAVAKSLEPGDVLAIGVTSSTPKGLLRKIVSVTQNGSMIVATTTQGTLAEAFQQASFSYQGTLGPQTFHQAHALRSGVKVLRINRQESLQQATSSSTSLSDPCAANLATFIQLIDVPIVQDGSGSITATGQIEVCPSLQFDWNIGGIPEQLNSLTATATMGTDVHVNVTGRYDNSFDTSVPILRLDTEDPITVFVGPVPIVVFPELTFFVGASGDVTVGFSTGVTQTVTTTGGISYNNGKASPVFNSTSNFGTDPFGIDAGLSAKGFAGVTIDLDIDGVVSPGFSPDGFLNLAVTPLQNPWWTLTGGLEGSGSVSVGIFGLVNLADIDFPDLFQFSKTIAQAGGGFLTSDAAPTLAALQPDAAALDSPDLTVALTGTNFVPGATVSFNGVTLPTTFKDPNDLTVTLGASELATAGTFPVSVTNPDTPGATSSSLNFTVSTSAGNPVPSITSLSPASAVAGTSGQTVAINGQNFLSTSTVTYDGVSHAATYVNSGQLTITLSASDLATVGSFPVVVTNPAPGGGASNAVDFNVGYPTPSISSISPNSAAAGSSAQTLTVNGSNFLNSSSVTFDGSPLVTTFVSSTQLTAMLTTSELATAGIFPVSVINPAPGGGTSNVVDFTVSSGTPGSVTLNPTSVTVPEGGAQTFTASVADSSDGVAWTVQEGSTGGSITSSTSSSAVYMPPNTTGTFHIVATSLDNSAESAIATVTVVPAGTFIVLHSFQGSSQGDGARPESSLIQASNGMLYGTTSAGGTSSSGGTIFTVDSSGSLNVVYSFTSPAGPEAGLVQASDGNLYGTTSLGGQADAGTIFKMDASGNVTVLHSFAGPDGTEPIAALIQASDGDLYGTAAYGGASSNCPAVIGVTGCGTLFKLDASGNSTVLHSFAGPDGAVPAAALIQASDGSLYGTTTYGGNPSCNNGTSFPAGCGTIFKVDPSGVLTTLHLFSGADAMPRGALIQASDGSFYGATMSGGSAGQGTIFKMDASGNVTVLHSFAGPDGAGPTGIIRASDGNFYGTTVEGGELNDGTVFKMDPSGNVTVLHSFSGKDGTWPWADLVQAADGNLYGTTYLGGSANLGVVFRFDLQSSSTP